jgi:hypothetical protein
MPHCTCDWALLKQEYMKSPRFTDDDLDFEYDQLIGDSIRIDMELFLKELNEIHDMEYMI